MNHGVDRSPLTKLEGSLQSLYEAKDADADRSTWEMNLVLKITWQTQTASLLSFTVCHAGKKWPLISSNVMVTAIGSHMAFITFNCASSNPVFSSRLWRTSSLACSSAICAFWYATSFCSLSRYFDCLSNSCSRDSNDCCSSDTSNFLLQQQ